MQRKKSMFDIIAYVIIFVCGYMVREFVEVIKKDFKNDKEAHEFHDDLKKFEGKQNNWKK